MIQEFFKNPKGIPTGKTNSLAYFMRQNYVKFKAWQMCSTCKTHIS